MTEKYNHNASCNKNYFPTGFLLRISRNIINPCIILTVAAFFFIGKSSIAQTGSYNVRMITMEDGLPQSSVKNFLCDKNGIIWIGTGQGIARYEGNKFHVIKAVKGDSSKLNDAYLYDMFEDSKGRIWIMTNSGGLSVYTPSDGKIKTFLNNSSDKNSIPDNSIRKVIEVNGNIWIASHSSGFAKYNENNQNFTRYFSEGDHPFRAVSSVIADHSGIFWVSTEGRGLIRISKDMKSYKQFMPDGTANSIQSNDVYDLYEDSYNNIWIASQKGIRVLDERREKFNRPGVSALPPVLESGIVNRMLFIENREIWFSTIEGLYRFDLSKRTVEHIALKAQTGEDFSRTNITRLAVDKTGMIWAGSPFYGAFCLYKDERKIKAFTVNEVPGKTLSSKVIRSLYSDKKGYLWAGTQDKGLNRINLKTGIIDIFRGVEAGGRLVNDQVSALCIDSRERLWIGTWKNGLSYADRIHNATGSVYFRKVQTIEHEEGYDSDIIIMEVFEDSKGRIWVGSNFGLGIYDERKGKVNYPLKGNENIFARQHIQSKSIKEDKKGNLWAGTWNGLYKIEVKETSDFYMPVLKAVRIDEYVDGKGLLYSGKVISLKYDNSGNLWIGSFFGGLYFLDAKQVSSGKDSVKLVNYSEKDGILNNTVYAIEEDLRGNIWFSTNLGLYSLNKTTSGINRFTKENGLLNQSYYWGAGSTADNGYLFFGGQEGINMFKPEELIPTLKYSPVIPVITGVKIFGNALSEEKIFKNGETIEIDYKENHISFDFLLPDYRNPSKIKHFYTLEGFDSTWIASGSINSAGFTNLEAGTYKFRIQATDFEGSLSKEFNITIKVNPPFWQTLWFRISVFIALIILVAVIIKLRENHIHKINTELENLVEEKKNELLKEIEIRKLTEEELKKSQSKLIDDNLEKERVFSLLTTDIKNPFSVIIGLSGMISSEMDSMEKPEILEYLEAIDRTSTNVFNLLDNLLEWSRIHGGRLTISPKSFAVESIIENIMYFYEKNARSKELEFIIEQEDDIYAFADPNHIEKIVRNFILNSIKYTNKGGKIKIKTAGKNAEILISVEDNGIGLTPYQISNIEKCEYGEVKTGTMGEKGAGLGLPLSFALAAKNNGRIEVLSSQGVKTIFTLIIPKFERQID